MIEELYIAPVTVTAEEGSVFGHSDPIFKLDETFTRSNGTTIARIYERLTKASRRRAEGRKTETAYRQGVYDAFKALQEELSE